MAKKIKILAIDDEVILTDSIRKIIETELDWDVDTINNPKEALAHLKSKKSFLGLFKHMYDCIIVDLKMPDLTGFEFIAEWRKIEGKHQIPIILLTAYEDADKWKTATSTPGLDISAYLKKPIKRQELTTALERIVVQKDVSQMKEDLKEKAYDKVYNLKNAAEHNAAKKMQEAALPSNTPHIDGIEIKTFFKTAKFIGGDFYDFFPINDHKLGIVLVDIVGKGVPACMMMMRLKELLKSQINENISPKEFIYNVNRIICEDDSYSKYAPMMFCIIDTQEKTLSYVNTLGNSGGILLSNGTLKTLDVGGLMVGADVDEQYEQEVINLKEGDFIVLYTDGLVEQVDQNKTAYEARFMTQFMQYKTNPPADLVDILVKDFDDFRQDMDFQDDTTILSFSLKKL